MTDRLSELPADAVLAFRAEAPERRHAPGLAASRPTRVAERAVGPDAALSSA
jgi:hypothetical protein